MTKDAATLLEDIAVGHGVFVGEILEDYSGRGMYGKTTVAVVMECDAFRAGIYVGLMIAAMEEATGERDRHKYSIDNMGKSSIVVY